MTSELTTLGDKRGRSCVRMGSDQPWVVECGGGVWGWMLGPGMYGKPNG